MSLISDMLINLADSVRRAATARIGSAQRRAHAVTAHDYALKLAMPEASSAALLANMAANAWNENKRANQRRLRWANRQLAAIKADGEAWLAGSPAAFAGARDDLDAECERTFVAADALRTQAIAASRKLRDIAHEVAGR